MTPGYWKPITYSKAQAQLGQQNRKGDLMTKSTQIQSRRFTEQHKEYLHPACQERLHMTGFNLEATPKYSKNV